MLRAIKDQSGIEIVGPKDIVAHAATVNGTNYIFFANFSGLKAGEIATPISQSGISIHVPAQWGSRMRVLPFLGTESIVKGANAGTAELFRLPALERGSVVWFSN